MQLGRELSNLLSEVLRFFADWRYQLLDQYVLRFSVVFVSYYLGYW
jgi:hypothetical protein